MKKIYKYIGLLSILICSFYYTDKISIMVRDKNPIMKDINEVSSKYEVSYVNAIIEDNTIIPGKSGIEVNKEKSFYTMKAFGQFNEYYLSYEKVKPKINLEHNKDKIIIKGNNIDNNVSIIIENNSSLISYFKTKNIAVDLLVDTDNIDTFFENINNNSEKYNYIDALLTKNNLNTNLCVLTNNNIEKICRNNNKYLIKTDIILNDSTIINVKNNLKNGMIIFIEENTSIDNVDVILKEIRFKGLNIVKLSKLIEE